MTVLRVENVSKRYGAHQAVASLSFSLDAGEILAIMGPNGAGKSTLFSMIAGTLVPDSGDIWINGLLQVEQSLWKRVGRGLGYLPQQSVGFVELDLIDNLKFSGATEEAMNQALAQVGIVELKQKKLGQLSGGERRRFDLSRCLLLQPTVLLLDEPFAGLDPLAIQDLCARIVGFADAGLSIVVSDHAVSTTLNLCHEAIIMDSGRCVFKGCPEDAKRSKVVKERYLGFDAGDMV